MTKQTSCVKKLLLQLHKAYVQPMFKVLSIKGVHS